MTRKPRVHFPGAFYHVIDRGNRGQKVFRDDQDYERYWSLLEKIAEDGTFATAISTLQEALTRKRKKKILNYLSPIVKSSILLKICFRREILC